MPLPDYLIQHWLIFSAAFNILVTLVYANRIDFADVFRTPQVVYINLPSTLGTASSAEIARIALYSLIGSARLTPDNERKQVFVFIDEFQRIIANKLEMIMQTARSMKVGMILANQSMLDLKKADTDQP